MAPHAIDSVCYDFLLDPDCRLKVTSICLGPFDKNPTGLKLKLKLRDFKNVNLFHSNTAYKEGKGMEQIVFFESQESKFYILIALTIPEVVVSEDICVMLSTEKKAKVSKFPPLKFRFWLNAKFIKARVGNSTFVQNVPLEKIDYKSLLPTNPHLNTPKTSTIQIPTRGGTQQN